MSTDHEHDDHEPDDAPSLPERHVLDAWQVPAPAPDLTSRVMAHVDAALPSAAVPMLPVAPRRGGLGLAVVGVAMLAAAAVVLGIAQPWSRPPAAETSSVVVAAPPVAEPIPAVPVPGGAPQVLRDTTPNAGTADLDDPFTKGPAAAGTADLDDPFATGPAAAGRPDHSKPEPSPRPAGAPDLDDPFTKGSAGTDPGDPPRGSSPGLLDPFRKDARATKPDDAAKTARLRIGTQYGQRPAEVFIDDVRVGTTPIMNTKVTPGRHTVRWQWEDGTTTTVELEIAAGETKTVKSPQATP